MAKLNYDTPQWMKHANAAMKWEYYKGAAIMYVITLAVFSIIEATPEQLWWLIPLIAVAVAAAVAFDNFKDVEHTHMQHEVAQQTINAYTKGIEAQKEG